MEEKKRGILAAFMVPHPPLIIPAVGRGGEAQIEETAIAYREVAEEIASLKPDTIIITSPHQVMYADYFHISPGRSAKGSFSLYNASAVSFSEVYDTELVDKICSLAALEGLDAGTLGERDKELDHGTMVPLWFVENIYKDFRLVRIGLSGLPYEDHYRLGQVISRAAYELGRRAVFIASGDLSHKLQSYGPYGYAPEGPEYDAKIMDIMGRAAFDELFDLDEAFCRRAAECGHRSFIIMAGAFDGLSVRARAMSHQDITGVGYGICTFYPEEPDDKRCFLEKASNETEDISDLYVNLARETIESYVQTGRAISVPEGLPEEMMTGRAGVFVSIHKAGNLRGCIGTIMPTCRNIAQEIIRNAISASTEDPRFRPVEADELGSLEINVDVLTEPENISSKDELDVKKYGVIVRNGFRRGLLLPDLEGVDTVEQQIDIARRKAGIGSAERLSLQRFEVIRHT